MSTGNNTLPSIPSWLLDSPPPAHGPAEPSSAPPASEPSLPYLPCVLWARLQRNGAGQILGYLWQGEGEISVPLEAPKSSSPSPFKRLEKKSWG